VSNQATAFAVEQDIVSRLARFFPEAIPLRIPIKLSRATANGKGDNHGKADVSARKNNSSFLQDTVIEFGTPREVLFMVNCPLEFADHVLLESRDGSMHAEASVVAVQYHLKKTVVAVRFLKPVPNWIVKS